PKAGTTVAQMQAFGVVESVKAVSDLFAPLSGQVVEVNAELTQKPEWVNQDPYGKGWMIGIALANPNELEALMTAAHYEEYIEKGGHA
ncbi:MAG: glycine cleavage system protein H, partial [Candidatus Rokubacteria bacterium]|nr:glycine cleavage system protein H [Candidatus Rokubacteria bacterium]